MKTGMAQERGAEWDGCREMGCRGATAGKGMRAVPKAWSHTEEIVTVTARVPFDYSQGILESVFSLPI